MSKRSAKFARKPRDFYPTPREAVLPLIPFLPTVFSYWEPCAGDFSLCLHLDALTESDALLTEAIDIEPRSDSVDKGDALSRKAPHNTMCIITNPPWSRDILHKMIPHFASQRPTWLLFDADWMHTRQARPYLRYCSDIVSVGRVSWEQNGVSGFDNCCWYGFGKFESKTNFHARMP